MWCIFGAQGKCDSSIQNIDSLQHDLLLGKLNAYGFSHQSIKTISSFLSERRFRTKVNS